MTNSIVKKIEGLIALAASSEREEARTAAMAACRLIREHKLQFTKGPRVPFGLPRQPDDWFRDGIPDYEDWIRRACRQHDEVVDFTEADYEQVHRAHQEAIYDWANEVTIDDPPSTGEILTNVRKQVRQYIASCGHKLHGYDACWLSADGLIRCCACPPKKEAVS